jgi:hypothetical protein
MRSDTRHHADRNVQQQRLRHISRVAEWIALGAIVLVVAYCLYLWWDEEAQMAFLNKDVPGLSFPPSAAVTRLAFWLNLIPPAIFAIAMWEARQLFRLFGTGHVFGPATPRHLVRLGVLAIAAAAAGMVVRTLVVLLMTSADLPGHQQLVLGIGSNELAALVAGLLFLAFALIMQEALLINDDNASIV